MEKNIVKNVEIKSNNILTIASNIKWEVCAINKLFRTIEYSAEWNVHVLKLIVKGTIWLGKNVTTNYQFYIDDKIPEWSSPEIVRDISQILKERYKKYTFMYIMADQILKANDEKQLYSYEKLTDLVEEHCRIDLYDQDENVLVNVGYEAIKTFKESGVVGLKTNETVRLFGKEFVIKAIFKSEEYEWIISHSHGFEYYDDIEDVIEYSKKYRKVIEDKYKIVIGEHFLERSCFRNDAPDIMGAGVSEDKKRIILYVPYENYIKKYFDKYPVMPNWILLDHRSSVDNHETYYFLTAAEGVFLAVSVVAIENEYKVYYRPCNVYGIKQETMFQVDKEYLAMLLELAEKTKKQMDIDVSHDKWEKVSRFSLDHPYGGGNF